MQAVTSPYKKVETALYMTSASVAAAVGGLCGVGLGSVRVFVLLLRSSARLGVRVVKKPFQRPSRPPDVPPSV